ncbi:MAG TPA: PilZ domain-containing protein [Devosiaceae bacterium]|jgi:hypothetical protein
MGLVQPFERRGAYRRNTDITATVVFDSGRGRVTARMKNLSETGARIELSSLSDLPEDFYMLIAEHGMQPCRIVWKEGSVMGLAFSS